jgi:hypothetical protein
MIGCVDLRPETRALLALFSTLTLLAVVVLAGRPEATDEFFAWTIKPPLTAAFLGAGYAAGCVLVALSLRSGRWSAVRAPLLTILVFTAVTLLATLLHLEKFHLDGPASIATAAGWFWLAVYVVVPPLMLAVWLRQDRMRPRGTETDLPRPLVVALSLEGLFMLAVGVVLFVAPATAETLWPWPLTPLTARAVAAWLIAFGLATLWCAFRETLADARVQALSYTVFGIAELLMLVRFRSTPDWSATAWIYVLALVAVTVTGAAGLLLARSSRPAPRRTVTT